MLTLSSENTGFSMIPFQSHSSSLGMTLSAGFHPQLTLGISILDGDGSVGGGVFLDLPKVAISIDEVNGVNSKCEIDSDSTNTYNGLFNVVPTASVGAGLFATADVDILHYTVSDQSTFAALSTPLSSIATKCYSFNHAAGTYGSPSRSTNTATATVTSTGTSTGTAKPNGAALASNPFGKMKVSLGREVIGALSLVAVSAFFISL